MRHNRTRLSTVLFLLGATAVLASASSVDLSAPAGFGAASVQGNLEIWRQINEVGLNFGKSSYLPLRYKFSSDPATGGVLGPGFYVPMLEARCTLIREQMMRANLPCGKQLYLLRDNINPNKFQTLDQKWTAYLSGNSELTISRADGWTIVYHQGRLASITTDDKRVFTWTYDSNSHMVTEISEDGQSLITVEPNRQGLIGAIVFDGKRYELGYTERPLTEMIAGQVAVKQLALALSSFKYPDGKSETFKFALSPQRAPTVAFTDPNQKETDYTWDAATNYIASEKGTEGIWIYNVGTITRSFGLPPITRISPDGKSESKAIDNATGTTTEKSLEGITTVTSTFKTPGPLYGKVKQITEISATGNSRVLARLSYDENGLLIRKVDVDGFTTTMEYNSDGHVTKKSVLPPSDPAILRQLGVIEESLVKEVAAAKGVEERDGAYFDLGMFYIYRLGDLSRALGLTKSISDKEVAADILIQVVVGNRNLSESEKLARLRALAIDYPEKQYSLSKAISLYDGAN